MRDFSKEAVVWVSVPVPRSVLQHFIIFDDPSAEMGQVLVDAMKGLDQANGDAFVEGSHPSTEKGEGQKAAPTGLPNNPFDQIRAALSDVDKRAGGYRSIRVAAEMAYRFFGLSWLDPDPRSSGSEIRERLRKILWDALSDSHSNKSVPWRRFQDFAASYGDAAAPDES